MLWRTRKSDDMIHVTGVTGSAIVPAFRVASMEVGELLLGPTYLPIVPDVFGGAQGVLGREGLHDMRIYADFGRDKLTITHSRDQHAGLDFTVVPLKLVHDGLLMADALVGRVHTHAIIDTGAQRTLGNEALRAGAAAPPTLPARKREDIERRDARRAVRRQPADAAPSSWAKWSASGRARDLRRHVPVPALGHDARTHPADRHGRARILRRDGHRLPHAASSSCASAPRSDWRTAGRAGNTSPLSS